MNSLQNALASNTRQGQQAVPFQQHLENLTSLMVETDTTELSTLQMMTLKSLEVHRFLGRDGARWLNETIRTQSYDIASLSTQVTAAFQAMNDANNMLKLAAHSLEEIGITADEKLEDTSDARYRVAIIFKSDASIRNVADLRKRTNDWHVTISGIAGAIGEKAEDTKVTGADTGSLLVFLGMTAKAALLLAVISKAITVVASNILELQIKAEELRAKQLTNDKMEQAFADQAKDLKEQAVAKTLATVEPYLAKPLSPDMKSKLELSVQNLLRFAELGGEVDIETPEELDKDDKELLDEAVAEVTAELRRMVIAKREADRSLKALTDQRHG